MQQDIIIVMYLHKQLLVFLITNFHRVVNIVSFSWVIPRLLVLYSEKSGCMNTELSGESDSWNSGEVFYVHYCFNCSVFCANKQLTR